jgi:hypothetical protein
MTQPAVRQKNTISAHPITSATIAILLAANIFFIVFSPIYSSLTPKVGDFPFFYFYLLIFMPITSLVLWVVVQLQKRITPPSGSAPEPREPRAGAAAGSEAA